MNKGRQLHITGNLTINGADITSVSGLSNITSVSGTISFYWCAGLTQAPFLNTITQAGSLEINYCGLTSLSFNNLNSFSGHLWLRSLDKLTQVSFAGLTTVTGVYIASCPLLTDVSFLSNLKSSGGFTFYRVGVTAINLDNLNTVALMDVSVCQNLRSVSMKSLTSIIGTGALNLAYCPALTSLDFNALTSVGGKLTVSAMNLTDLSVFKSLKTIGSLTVYGNPLLSDIKGLWTYNKKVDKWLSCDNLFV